MSGAEAIPGPLDRGASTARLALETSTATGSVALWREGLLAEVTFRIQGMHSERVLPAVEYALKTAGLTAEEIEAVVVGAGPGSFTGVRIGASLAKGWAAVRDIPLFAYPSLMALAAGAGGEGPICAMFDARRGEVYAACYEVSDGGIVERLAPGVWPVEILLERLGAHDLKPAFVGDGAIRYAQAIRGAAPAVRILPHHLAVPRAASLLWLCHVMPELGRIPLASQWEPVYIREWRASGEEESSR